MKLTILILSLLMLTGCGTGAAESLFRIIPVNSDICPHGRDVSTNQCNN
ncbi:hypothetical protein LLR08_09505 [Rouxiella badensis]|jgi:hypothetical protein|nr:hypothetical protein [Rouxiella badensis]MCC3702790.1 hypothetical protein [Rouxiella badensis]MCC3730259.1 hypothetical protein [Rouxiella badensis]MCC3741703.1 hypothetical protein [Rouxiella badensis]QOI56885.1 hypothetical protein H2866_07140 [Rouxiella badensis subsp. acadiensis]